MLCWYRANAVDTVDWINIEPSSGERFIFGAMSAQGIYRFIGLIYKQAILIAFIKVVRARIVLAKAKAGDREGGGGDNFTYHRLYIGRQECNQCVRRVNPLTTGAKYIGFFTQLLPHSVPPFKHVKAIMWHQSARFKKSWPPFCQIWIILTHLMLWIASARHNFMWVKILIQYFGG